MANIIHHLAFRADWEAGVASGEYRAPSLAEEGFIHASGDEEQMLRVRSACSPGASTCWLWRWTSTACPRNLRSYAKQPAPARFTHTSTAPSTPAPWCACDG